GGFGGFDDEGWGDEPASPPAPPPAAAGAADAVRGMSLGGGSEASSVASDATGSTQGFVSVRPPPPAPAPAPAPAPVKAQTSDDFFSEFGQ
ncbi:hypothetical protein TeGR_g11851, partial [Tetraparma gracilis]